MTAPWWCPEHTDDGACRACTADHKAGAHGYPRTGCPLCKPLPLAPTRPWEYR